MRTDGKVLRAHCAVAVATVLATGGCELIAGIEKLSLVGDGGTQMDAPSSDAGMPEQGSDASMSSADAQSESESDVGADVVVTDVVTADGSVGGYVDGGREANAMDDARASDASVGEGSNLLLNPSCEDGTLAWSSLGDSPIQSSTRYVHSGDQHSCRVYDRTSTFNGPMQDITAIVVPGHQYAASAWAVWALAPDAGADSSTTGVQSLYLTVLQTCGTTTTYERLASATNAPAGQWTSLTSATAALTVPTTCSPLDLQLYVEGPDAGLDLYADEVSLFANN